MLHFLQKFRDKIITGMHCHTLEFAIHALEKEMLHTSCWQEAQHTLLCKNNKKFSKEEHR
jgi:hypothetical protein